MACGGCLAMRHAAIRVVVGQRIADKLVPSQAKTAPPKTGKSTETVVRRNIIIRAKRG
jgi:hypothetical protein